jgi:hypothetical protein
MTKLTKKRGMIMTALAVGVMAMSIFAFNPIEEVEAAKPGSGSELGPIYNSFVELKPVGGFNVYDEYRSGDSPSYVHYGPLLHQLQITEVSPTGNVQAAKGLFYIEFADQTLVKHQHNFGVGIQLANGADRTFEAGEVLIVQKGSNYFYEVYSSP